MKEKNGTRLGGQRCDALRAQSKKVRNCGNSRVAADGLATIGLSWITHLVILFGDTGVQPPMVAGFLSCESGGPLGLLAWIFLNPQ